VRATERGRINTAEFTLFNFAYDAVEDAIKDRRIQLDRAERQYAGGAATLQSAPQPAKG